MKENKKFVNFDQRLAAFRLLEFELNSKDFSGVLLLCSLKFSRESERDSTFTIEVNHFDF